METAGPACDLSICCCALADFGQTCSWADRGALESPLVPLPWIDWSTLDGFLLVSEANPSKMRWRITSVIYLACFSVIVDFSRGTIAGCERANDVLTLYGCFCDKWDKKEGIWSICYFSFLWIQPCCYLIFFRVFWYLGPFKIWACCFLFRSRQSMFIVHHYDFQPRTEVANAGTNFSWLWQISLWTWTAW